MLKGLAMCPATL